MALLDFHNLKPGCCFPTDSATLCYKVSDNIIKLHVEEEGELMYATNHTNYLKYFGNVANG